jgi:hypothetical protein
LNASADAAFCAWVVSGTGGAPAASIRSAQAPDPTIKLDAANVIISLDVLKTCFILFILLLVVDI